MITTNQAITLARRTYKALIKLTQEQRDELELAEVMEDAARFLTRAGHNLPRST